MLNGPLSFSELHNKCKIITEAVEGLEANFILLELNPKSKDFLFLLDDILSLSNVHCPDPRFLGEDELKELIEDLLIEMKANYP
jgi:hypothetical protein